MHTLNLTKLNGITATIVACAACGMNTEKIAAKVSSKYSLDYATTLTLVVAVVNLV